MTKSAEKRIRDSNLGKFGTARNTFFRNGEITSMGYTGYFLWPFTSYNWLFLWDYDGLCIP